MERGKSMGLQIRTRNGFYDAVAFYISLLYGVLAVHRSKTITLVYLYFENNK